MNKRCADSYSKLDEDNVSCYKCVLLYFYFEHLTPQLTWVVYLKYNEYVSKVALSSSEAVYLNLHIPWLLTGAFDKMLHTLIVMEMKSRKYFKRNILGFVKSLYLHKLAPKPIYWNHWSLWSHWVTDLYYATGEPFWYKKILNWNYFFFSFHPFEFWLDFHFGVGLVGQSGSIIFYRANIISPGILRLIFLWDVMQL